MPIHYNPPAYPDILTDTNWQKKKGKISKLAGKTGVGELMDKAEAAYGAINWKNIELFKFAPQGDARADGDGERTYQKVVKDNEKILRDLEKALKALTDKATTVAAAWKKNKLIPADSAKHAAAVAKAADDLMTVTAIGTVSEFLKQQRDQIEVDYTNWKKMQAEGVKTLKKYVNGFAAAVKGKTVADYQAVWSEHIRGVGTQLAPLAKGNANFTQEYEVWRKYSNKLVIPPSEEEYKKQIVILQKVVDLLKPKLDQLG